MIRTDFKKIKKYVLVLLALFYSGHAVAATSNTWYDLSRYYFTFFILLLCLAAVNKKRSVRIGNMGPVCAIFSWAVILFFNCLIHSETESMTGYLMTFFIALLGFIFSKLIDSEAFGKTFVKIMFVVSIIALVFFYYVQFTAVFEMLPTLYGLDQFGKIVPKYKGLFFYYRLDPLRNSGPFWEPGIFASYLIFAILFVNRYIESKKRLKYYIVFTIALLSAASSAGYALLILSVVCIASYGITKIENDRKRLAYTILCLILVFAVFIIYLNLESFIEAVGLSDNSTVTKLLNISDNSRSTSIVWSWERFLEEPIFGHGVVGLSLQSSGVENSTTTSLRLMASLGIGGFLFTLLMMTGVFRQKNISVLTKISFLLIWLMISNKEGQDAFVLHWMLVFYFNAATNMLSAEKDKKNTDLLSGEI